MRCCKLTVRPGRDRGAVAVIVAILVGVGGLLGSVALTVDVGTVSLERRQLQNGADAAVFAAAMQCDRTGACPTATDARLTTLANNNAGIDALTSISRVDSQAAVCGRGAGLPACVASPGPALRDCPTPATALPATYVRVYTETKTSTGNTILPSGFAEALTGSPSGTRHQACAAAAWGPPSPGAATLPFAISACEWFKDTNNGDPSKYAPLPSATTYPQYSPTFPDSYEQALPLNEPLLPVTDPCYSWQGHDFAGGFGWLDRTDAPDCQAKIDPVTHWVGVITGIGGGSAGKCATVIEGYLGLVVEVPVFDCMSLTRTFCDNTDNGKQSNYHILSTAAFFITAFDTADVSGSIDKAHPTKAAQTACLAKGGKGSKCLYGWFVKKSGGGGIGGPGTPDFGDHVIQVIG